MDKFHGQDVFRIETSIKTAHQIDVLLRDALSDFIRLRTPTSQYLASRYSPEFLATHPDKAAEIESRINLAEQLLHSLIFVK